VRRDGRTQSLSDVDAEACDGRRVAIDAHARRRIARAQAWVGRMKTSRRQTVSGVHTGFDVLSEGRQESSQAEQLSSNLLLSHAEGVGEPLSQEDARAAMGAGRRKAFSVMRAKVPFAGKDQRLNRMLSRVARGVRAGEFSVPIADAG